MGLIVHLPFDKRKPIDFNNNLVDYSTWNLGTSGSQPGWSQNGTTNENRIISKENPLGKEDIVWATEENDAIDTSSDGGFNSPSVAIDTSKIYRFSVWLRRENVTSVDAGTSYFGFRGYNASGSSSTADQYASGDGFKDSGNIYFTAPSYAYYTNGTLPQDEWHLWVGYVNPVGVAKADFAEKSQVPGIYNMSGDKLMSIGDNFRWGTSTAKVNIRSYLFYSGQTDERSYWYRPRIDLVDGNEPTFDDLLHLREADILNNITDEIHNTSLTYEALTFKSDGKTHKNCVAFNDTAYIDLKKDNQNISFNKIFEGDFTVSAWIRLDNMHTTTDNSILGYGTGSTNKHLHLTVRSTNPYMGFWGNDLTTTGHSWAQGKWYHIAFVGDKSNMKQHIYVDGVEIKNRSVTSWLDFADTEHTPKLFRYGSHSLDGSCNDFRIYDHALTSTEVSELSKGLKVHYKFGTVKKPKNLIGNGAFEGGNGVEFESGSSGINTIVEKENPGKTKWVLEQGTAASNTSIEYEIHPNIPLKPSTQYCISCLVAYTSDWVGNDQIFHSRWYDENKSGHITTGSGTLSSTTSSGGLDWQYRYLTFTTSSTLIRDDYNYSRYNWYLGYPTKNTAGKRYFTNLQLEEGSTPTTYEYSGDVEKIGYDLSVNNTNFLIDTLFPNMEDKALVFTGNDNEYVKTEKPISGKSFTFNLWYKGNPDTSKRYPILVLNESNNIYHSARTKQFGLFVQSGKLSVHFWGGEDISGLGSNINDNIWHMLTVIVDTHLTDSTQRTVKAYIDKVEIGSRNYSQASFDFYQDHHMWLGYNHNYYDAWNKTLTNSRLSDVRVYSKKLTQTEIDSLHTGGRQ